jgi:hypothetical protein
MISTIVTRARPPGRVFLCHGGHPRYSLVFRAQPLQLVADRYEKALRGTLLARRNLYSSPVKIKSSRRLLNFCFSSFFEPSRASGFGISPVALPRADRLQASGTARQSSGTSFESRRWTFWTTRSGRYRWIAPPTKNRQCVTEDGCLISSTKLAVRSRRWNRGLVRLTLPRYARDEHPRLSSPDTVHTPCCGHCSWSSLCLSLLP